MPSLNIFLFLSELLPSSLMELQSACTSHWRSRSFRRCYLLEMTSLLHPVQLVLLPPDLSGGTPPRTPVWAALPGSLPLAGRLLQGPPCVTGRVGVQQTEHPGNSGNTTSFLLPIPMSEFNTQPRSSLLKLYPAWS